MKKIIIIIPIFFFSVLLIAQSDIIYPSNSKKSIKKCKIIKVTNHNIVHYVKNLELDSIAATAIVKDDVFINLKSSNPPISNINSDYYDYQIKYNRAITYRNLGIAITGIGVGLLAATLAINKSEKESGMGRPLTVIIGTGTTIITSVGILLWSSNAIKAVNNKKAMQLSEPTTTLSLGPTSSGVGLALRF